jgi:hypothetical protein
MPRLLAALTLILLAVPTTTAHEIPSEVTIYTVLKPE